jgi:hypothetical protein
LLDRELRRASSECRAKLSGLGYNIDNSDFAEMLVYCGERGPVLVKIHVEFIVRVKGAESIWMEW